jgi:ubiquitin-large subunit ribosomal protein L40e
MIKTLNFGTITLEIEKNNTINLVKKMARLKLDYLTQGLDSELWISNETELICNGKLLEDDKTVSDYNIQKDATLRMVFGLIGGVIVKKHATKKEKLKNLQMRSIEHIRKEKEMDISFEIPSVDMPPAMNNVLQPMREKLERAKAMSSQDLFANILANLPDKAIEQLEEVICNLYTITTKNCFTFKNIIIWTQI